MHRGNSSLHCTFTKVVFPADGKELSPLQCQTHTRPYSRLVDDVHATVCARLQREPSTAVSAIPSLSAITPVKSTVRHPTTAVLLPTLAPSQHLCQPRLQHFPACSTIVHPTASSTSHFFHHHLARPCPDLFISVSPLVHKPTTPPALSPRHPTPVIFSSSAGFSSTRRWSTLSVLIQFSSIQSCPIWSTDAVLQHPPSRLRALVA